MICRGPYSDVEIPEVPLTGFVLSRAAALGEKPAVLDGSSGRVLTYGGLAGAVRRVAAGLAGSGFGKGDVFAVHGTREESSRAN